MLYRRSTVQNFERGLAPLSLEKGNTPQVLDGIDKPTGRNRLPGRPFRATNSGRVVLLEVAGIFWSARTSDYSGHWRVPPQ